MDKNEKFVFGKENYIIIIIGFVVTLIGFMLMMGGGSEDPNVFDGEALFSNRRITLAPILVIAGYGVVIYGIMRRRKAN